MKKLITSLFVMGVLSLTYSQAQTTAPAKKEKEKTSSTKPAKTKETTAVKDSSKTKAKPNKQKAAANKAKASPKANAKAAEKANENSAVKYRVIDSITTPALQLEATEVNFGEFKEGEVITKEVRFWNIGTQDLILTEVKPSCGCTTPGYTKEPVKPGESGVITIQYDSRGRPGNFHKSVTVKSNDPRQPQFQVIRIFGNAVPQAPAPAPEPPKPQN